MDRLEEIRQYAEAELSNPDYNGPVHKESARRHARYCLYLLERVERLEKERKLMLDHMARNGHLGPGGGW